jgi:hypothetical protein
MRFNANWQGVDGSMISWISNENNTGVSSSTFVMVGGQFYDLGKPILGAALNQGFILAIHCEDGAAVFCEYQINNNGSVTKKFEKNLNDLYPIDNEEISKVENKINIESGMPNHISGYWRNLEFKAWKLSLNYLRANNVFNDNLRCSFSPNGTELLLHLRYGHTQILDISLYTPHEPSYPNPEYDIKQLDTNGFALFDLKINSTETVITFKERRRFESPYLSFFYDMNSYHDKYYYYSESKIELNCDNFFIFAEFSNGDIPTWLNAEISINGKVASLDPVLFPHDPEGMWVKYRVVNDVNYNVAIKLNTENTSFEVGKDNSSNNQAIPIIDIGYCDLRCGFSEIGIIKFDLSISHNSTDRPTQQKRFVFSSPKNTSGTEKQLLITKELDDVMIATAPRDYDFFGEFAFSIIKGNQPNNGTTHPKTSCAYSLETNEIVYYASSGLAGTFNGEVWAEFESSFIDNHQIAFYYIDMGD